MKILTNSKLAEIEDEAWRRGNSYATNLLDKELVRIAALVENLLGNKEVLNSKTKKDVILKYIENAKKEITANL